MDNLNVIRDQVDEIENSNSTTIHTEDFYYHLSVAILTNKQLSFKMPGGPYVYPSQPDIGF
jgi:hypothetical protein